LLRNGFDHVEELIKQTALEEHQKLAELLLNFYEVHGQEKEFLKWALEKEVRETIRYPYALACSCFISRFSRVRRFLVRLLCYTACTM
jgi:hypothetical protein